MWTAKLVLVIVETLARSMWDMQDTLTPIENAKCGVLTTLMTPNNITPCQRNGAGTLISPMEESGAILWMTRKNGSTALSGDALIVTQVDLIPIRG